MTSIVASVDLFDSQSPNRFNISDVFRCPFPPAPPPKVPPISHRPQTDVPVATLGPRDGPESLAPLELCAMSKQNRPYR